MMECFHYSSEVEQSSAIISNMKVGMDFKVGTSVHHVISSHERNFRAMLCQGMGHGILPKYCMLGWLKIKYSVCGENGDRIGGDECVDICCYTWLQTFPLTLSNLRCRGVDEDYGVKKKPCVDNQNLP